MTAAPPSTAVDLHRLFRLGRPVPRFGAMLLARRWNSDGTFGRFTAMGMKRVFLEASARGASRGKGT